MLELYNDRVHKARKGHKCEYCGQIIPRGIKYHRQSGKYEGEFFDRCLHVHCANMVSKFIRERDEEEFDYDWITDWLRDVYCYDCKKHDACQINAPECEVIIKDFREEEEK